jgi:hypothetical protein
MIPEWNKVKVESVDLSNLLEGRIDVRIIEEGECYYEEERTYSLLVDDVITDSDDIPTDLDELETWVTEHIYEAGLHYEGDQESIEYTDHTANDVYVTGVNVHDRFGRELNSTGYRDLISI